MFYGVDGFEFFSLCVLSRIGKSYLDGRNGVCLSLQFLSCENRKSTFRKTRKTDFSSIYRTGLAGRCGLLCFGRDVLEAGVADVGCFRVIHGNLGSATEAFDAYDSCEFLKWVRFLGWFGVCFLVAGRAGLFEPLLRDGGGDPAERSVAGEFGLSPFWFDL